MHDVRNGRERYAWAFGGGEMANRQPFRRLLDERYGLGGKGGEFGAYVHAQIHRRSFWYVCIVRTS